MISTVKKEIAISKELHSKIEWACTFSNCEPKIKNGNLRMIEKTNIAYVEPHTAVILEKEANKTHYNISAKVRKTIITNYER